MKRKPIPLIMLALWLAAGIAHASDTLLPVTSLTAHNNRDNFSGNLSDLTSGEEIAKPDPLSPSTWTASGGSYTSEWQGYGLLTNAANGKIGWVTLDLGSPKTVVNLYLWNIRQATGKNSETKSFNVYYAQSPATNPPAAPTDTTVVDYDFASGGWTLLNGGGPLTLASSGAAPDPADGIVPLGGVMARYIGIEILSNSGSAKVGLSEVAVAGPLILPPDGLSASLGPRSGSVRLDWSVVTNATAYNVKRSYTNSGYTTIGTVSTTNFTDFNLKFLTNYYYAVSSTNNNAESPDSAPLLVNLPIPGTVISIR